MTQNPQLQPPVARKEHKETALHGTVLVDDYAWLREKENPEVTAYLEAENAFSLLAFSSQLSVILTGKARIQPWGGLERKRLKLMAES